MDDEPEGVTGPSRQDRAAFDAVCVAFDLLDALTSDAAWESRADKIREASRRAYDASLSLAKRQTVVSDLPRQSDEHLAKMDAHLAAFTEAFAIVRDVYLPRSATSRNRHALAELLARAAVSGPTAATMFVYLPDAPGGRAWSKNARTDLLKRAIQILSWRGAGRCSGCGTTNLAPRTTAWADHHRRVLNGWCERCRSDDYARRTDREALKLLFDVIRPIGKVEGPSRRSRAA